MSFEAQLEALRRGCTDPHVGLFGPASKVWEINRHTAVFLGAGRAVLLQLAHPWVAQAIADHSRTEQDLLGRFRRTFLRVFAMVYGDLEAALAAAREVRALHDRVSGTLAQSDGAFAAGSPYRANQLAALCWVHATLFDTSQLVFERVVRPLRRQERELYFEETRRFAALFGIPQEELPSDAEGFAAYNRAMWESDELHPSDAARQIAEFLFRPSVPGSGPFMRWYRKLTAGLLPPRIRAGFGLPFDTSDRRLVSASLECLRRSERLWPQRLRYLPPYLSARRRLAGRQGPDPVGQMLEKLWIGAR